MTLRASYIGDRVTAAAMSLIGVQTLTPRLIGEEIWQAVEAARQRSELVIVDQDYAELILHQLIEATITEPIPPIVQMPSLDRDVTPKISSSQAARRVLGLEH